MYYFFLCKWSHWSSANPSGLIWLDRIIYQGRKTWLGSISRSYWLLVAPSPTPHHPRGEEIVIAQIGGTGQSKTADHMFRILIVDEIPKLNLRTRMI